MNPETKSTYLEERILTAGPLELTQILYDGAVDQVRMARRHLKEGDAFGRSRAVSKAQDILTELTLALNPTESKDSSVKYSVIYHQLQKRLVDAHMQQSDGIFSEVEAALAAMEQNWRGVTNLVREGSRKPEESRPQAVDVSRSGMAYGADATLNLAEVELERPTRSWSL